MRWQTRRRQAVQKLHREIRVIARPRIYNGIQAQGEILSGWIETGENQRIDLQSNVVPRGEDGPTPEPSIMQLDVTASQAQLHSHANVGEDPSDEILNGGSRWHAKMLGQLDRMLVQIGDNRQAARTQLQQPISVREIFATAAMT